MSPRKADVLQRRWRAESRVGQLGLWRLADDVRELLGSFATEDDVRETTMSVLTPLLIDGRLQAVDILADGTMQPWPGRFDEHAHRITEEWRVLGRAPGLGEIATLAGFESGSVSDEVRMPTPLGVLYQSTAVALDFEHLVDALGRSGLAASSDEPHGFVLLNATGDLTTLDSWLQAKLPMGESALFQLWYADGSDPLCRVFVRGRVRVFEFGEMEGAQEGERLGNALGGMFRVEASSSELLGLVYDPMGIGEKDDWIAFFDGRTPLMPRSPAGGLPYLVLARAPLAGPVEGFRVGSIDAGIVQIVAEDDPLPELPFAVARPRPSPKE